MSAPGALVGATDWCTHPADLAVTRVRGTKNPDVPAVVALAPDLVLANEEENRPADLRALSDAGLRVEVTYVRTVPRGIAELRRVLALIGVRPAWLDEAERIWAAPHDGPRRTAVVPIWRRPWMAVGSDTFTGDVLARLGVDNAFAGAAERYPRFDPALLPPVDLVVLPDEPYLFTATDGPEAFSVPAALVSGRHLTWYGPSLVEARVALQERLAQV